MVKSACQITVKLIEFLILLSICVPVLIYGRELQLLPCQIINEETNPVTMIIHKMCTPIVNYKCTANNVSKIVTVPIPYTGL